MQLSVRSCDNSVIVVKMLFIMKSSLVAEVLIRVSLALLALQLDKIHPFSRKIHPEELWLYKNPMTASYVTTTVLWVIVLILPTLAITLVYWIQRKRSDVTQALLACSLAWILNAFLTNALKVIVGRPRPDFFWRCYPDGVVSTDMNCTGDQAIINEGRRSFPSGHSSWSFAGMGFLSLYIAGKLHTFSATGKSQAWRLIIFLAPLCIALVIALSRTCDYHHHWQDVVCGSVLGFVCAYVCYQHYYPCLSSPLSHQPYSDIPTQLLQNCDENNTKWI